MLEYYDLIGRDCIGKEGNERSKTEKIGQKRGFRDKKLAQNSRTAKRRKEKRHADVAPKNDLTQ